MKKKGKSIAIFSSKGGSGKSTTALNIAGVFSLHDKKVLVIDFDLSSGGIATYLNVPFEKTLYNFIDDYANNRYNNITSYTTKYNDNISFLASPKDPRQGATISSSYVEIILDKAVYEYDLVIVDMNHVYSEININILSNVDNVLCLITNDLIDIKNARNLVNIFKSAEMHNYKYMLNESTNNTISYFSLYDIKSMMGSNIDYIIPKSFYYKSFGSLVVDGKIMTLEKRISKFCPKAMKTFEVLYNDIMEEKDEK